MDKKLINPDHWFLYKHVWPVGLQNNTLAVLGHIRVAGPFPPIAELQARWAAQVFKVNMIKHWDESEILILEIFAI